MKFAHLLVSAYFAERPETGLVDEAPAGVRLRAFQRIPDLPYSSEPAWGSCRSGVSSARPRKYERMP
jgi:hypothetical protein